MKDWPYSSFHRYLAQGIYSPDWYGTLDEGDFGELHTTVDTVRRSRNRTFSYPLVRLCALGANRTYKGWYITLDEGDFAE